MMSDISIRRISSRRPTASAFAAFLLLGLAIPLAALVVSSGAAANLNSVQVTIQTSEALPYQYTLAAYNTTGYQVASFNGNYPEAGFGLPSGTYLITASAYYQESSPCYLCAQPAGANGSLTPIRYFQPTSEYGYAVVDLTGPAQITIGTKNETSFSPVDMPVHVSFFNGTAAAGAYVSAYVVGMDYGYGQGWVSSGQTGSDGNFTLVMPDAPLEVNAYLSVPIQLPKGVTTVPVEIGGQEVNVTVNWQPDQVELYGQALILPPQSGADVTLQYRQSQYPIYYTNGQGSSQGVSTVTVTTTMASAQQAAPSGQSSRIAPFSPTVAQLSSPSQAQANPGPDPATIALVALGTGAGAVAIVAAAMVMGRRKRGAQSARL